MNKKTSGHPAENDSSAAQHPARPRRSERRCATSVLTVPECDSAGELGKFCDVLFPLLETAPRLLTLRFIGPHEMPSDSGLVLHHGLVNRPPGITVVTQAWSPVLGASMLIWLLGDVREIRPTANLRFRSLEQVIRLKKQRPPWEEAWSSAPADGEPEVNLAVEDYRTVLRLMDEYLPVDQWAGKLITPAMLRELGLVGHSPLDDLLQKCLAKDAGSVSPDRLKPPVRRSEEPMDVKWHGNTGAKQ